MYAPSTQIAATMPASPRLAREHFAVVVQKGLIGAYNGACAISQTKLTIQAKRKQSCCGAAKLAAHNAMRDGRNTPRRSAFTFMM